ncbi:MAG: flavodoxin family protein [Euryarchaeota archaeon]|nr:flavodoxin family protein [Euryarchaeota archaeon]
MKTIVICVSVHHGNTKQIADAIAEVLRAQVCTPDKADAAMLADYELIGFGSGIYYGKHHQSLLDFVDNLPTLNKQAFVFSTRGGALDHNHDPLKQRLERKGLRIVAEFSCKGLDTSGVFNYIGGINNNRPNDNDLRDAQEFARALVEAPSRGKD